MLNGASNVSSVTVLIPIAGLNQALLWRNTTKSFSVDRVSISKSRKAKENQFAKSASMSSKMCHFDGRAIRIILITLIARDALALWTTLDGTLEGDCTACLAMTSRAFQFALHVDGL